MDNKQAKIYVAGHKGLVGSAIVRALQAAGYTNILTATRLKVDLLNQQAVLPLGTVLIDNKLVLKYNGLG